jgi:uncharacterized protein YndB with AHSA1/START domain
MGTRDIVLAVEIGAEPKVVHDAVATAAGVASFWAPDTEEDGEGLSIGFSTAPTRLPVEVVRASAPDAIEWRFGGDWPFWNGSRGSWTFTPSENGTTVLFQHLDYGDGMPDVRFGMVAYTWSLVLGKLKSVIESGGTPDPALR